MATLPNNIRETIQKVVSSQVKHGETTVGKCARLALDKIRQNGTLPRAAVEVAMMELVTVEVQKALKVPLPQTIHRRLCNNMPIDLASHIGVIPSWIAVQKGPGAKRVAAIYATADDWEACANIKMQLAKATARKGTRDLDIARLLRSMDAPSLGALIDVPALSH